MHDMLQLTTWMFIYTSTLLQIHVTTQPLFALCFVQKKIIHDIAVDVDKTVDLF